MRGLVLRLAVGAVSRGLASAARAAPVPLITARTLAAAGWLGGDNALIPDTEWPQTALAQLELDGMLPASVYARGIRRSFLSDKAPLPPPDADALASAIEADAAAAIAQSEPPLIVHVISPTDLIILTLDLWAMSGVFAIARGVPASPTSWTLFQPGFPAACAPLASVYEAVTAAILAGGEQRGAAVAWEALRPGSTAPPSQPAAAPLPPTGVRIRMGSVSWRAFGVPAVGTKGAAHVATGTIANGGGTTITLPVGTLRAGFVYRFEVDASLSAMWDYSSCSFAGWTGGGAGTAQWPRGTVPDNHFFDFSEILSPLEAQSASSPTLYVHMPPWGGVVNATPAAGGQALFTQFSLNTDENAWGDGDAGALGIASSPRWLLNVAPRSVAAAMFTTLPLSPRLAATLARIATGVFVANADTFLLSIAKNTADFLSACATADDSIGSATVGARGVDAGALPFVAEIAAVAAALYHSPYLACVAVGTGTAAFLRATPTPPRILNFVFRVDVSTAAARGSVMAPFTAFGGTGPLILNSSATTQFQGVLSVPSSWPGESLAAPSRSSTVLNIIVPPPGLSDMTTGGRIVIFIFAIDADGAVGVAGLPYLVKPVNSSGLGLASTIAVVIAAADSSANPISSIYLIAAAGSAIATAAGGDTDTDSVATAALSGQLLSAALTSIKYMAANAGRSVLLLSGGVAGSATATGAGTETGVVLDDSLLTVATGALASLTNSTTMPSSARADALDVLAAVLQLSMPLNTSRSVVGSLPVRVGASALSVLSNVVMAGSTAAVSGSGGLGAAEAASINAALNLLSTSILRSAAPGDAPISITAQGTGTGGCVQPGGISMTSLLIGAASSTPSSGYGGPAILPGAAIEDNLPVDTTMLHFPLAAPLSPCSSTTTIGSSRLLSSGSAALAALIPPPTLRLPQSIVAALRNKNADGKVAVRIVQWGTSPYNETSGLDKVSVSNPAANASIVSLTGETTDHRRLQAVIDYAVHVSGSGGKAGTLGVFGSGLRWLQSIVGATVVSPSAASPSSSSANAAASALTPAAMKVSDLIASRPLDARVVSVDLSVGGIAQTAFSTPLYITIPLRDLSIVTFNGKTGEPESVAVGQTAIITREFSVVCPRDIPTLPGTTVPAMLVAPMSSILKLWTQAPWVNVTKGFNLTATLALGAPTVARLKAITVVGYMAEIIQITEAAPIAGSDTLRPGGSSSAGTGLAPGGLVIGHAATNQSLSKLQTAATTYLTLVYAVDCGPVFGERELACGPGSAGVRMRYTCPSTSVVPTCLWFSVSKGEWTTDGCKPIRVTATAITCACNHLTSFAVRYAAVEHASSSVFAIDTPLQRTTPFALQSLYLLVFFSVALTAIIGTAYGAHSDAIAARGYAAALASRPPVAALKRSIAAGQGQRGTHPAPWFVDRHNPYEPPLPDAAPSARLLDAMVFSEVIIGSPSPGAGVGRHTGLMSAAVHTVWPAGPGAAAPPGDVAIDSVVAVSPVSSPVRPNEPFDGLTKQKQTLEAAPTTQQQTLARLYARLSSIAYKRIESPESAEAAFVEYESVDDAASSESISPRCQAAAIVPMPVAVSPFPQESASRTPHQLLSFGTALERRAVPLLRRVKSAWKAHGAPLVPLCRARLRWMHPLALLGPLSDPRSPRPMRWALAVGLGLQSLLFLTAASYSFLWGTRDERGDVTLPVLSAIGVGFLTVFSLFFSTFIHSIWIKLLRGAALGEWGSRFTHVAAEAERRKAAQALLDSLPLPTLARAAARLLRRGDARLFDETSPATRLDAVNRSGWVEAPRVCVSCCSPVLRCCGRHPIQKRVYMQRELARAEGYLGMALRRAARRIDVLATVHVLVPAKISAVAPAPASPGDDALVKGPSQELLAAAEAVELEAAWEALVEEAGSVWFVDSWRVLDLEVARESWGPSAAVVARFLTDTHENALRMARFTSRAAVRMRAEVRALLDGTPVTRAPPQHIGVGHLATNQPDDPDEQDLAQLRADSAAKDLDTQLAREAAEAERRFLLEEAPATEASAAAWIQRAEAQGPGPSRADGEPWLPRGCKFRSALIWFAYTFYIVFAAYYTLLFGLTVSAGPLGSLIAAATLAAIAEWTVLPVLRATLGAIYDTRLLPLMSPHFAWIPWLGRASGAVTALHVATLARAAACNDLPNSKAAGANEGGDACEPARATAVREAAGGPLVLPFAAAVSDAAILASAATLPMRHAPALALATAQSGVFGALALTDSEFRAPLAPFCALRGSAAAVAHNAHLELAVTRLRHALTTSIYDAVTEGSGWHARDSVDAALLDAAEAREHDRYEERERLKEIEIDPSGEHPRSPPTSILWSASSSPNSGYPAASSPSPSILPVITEETDQLVPPATILPITVQKTPTDATVIEDNPKGIRTTPRDPVIEDNQVIAAPRVAVLSAAPSPLSSRSPLPSPARRTVIVDEFGREAAGAWAAPLGRAYLQPQSASRARLPLPRGVVPLPARRTMPLPRPLMPVQGLVPANLHGLQLSTLGPPSSPNWQQRSSPSTTMTPLPRGVLPLPRGARLMAARPLFLPVTPLLSAPVTSPLLQRAAVNLIVPLGPRPPMARSQPPS